MYYDTEEIVYDHISLNAAPKLTHFMAATTIATGKSIINIYKKITIIIIIKESVLLSYIPVEEYHFKFVHFSLINDVIS